MLSGVAKNQKNPHAVALGRLGGLKGGPVKNPRKGFGSMTVEQRRAAALKGLKTRWQGK
jgi:hypothetical protein